MNNARAVDEPLHSSKRGDTVRCEKRTSRTGILGFRAHHRFHLTANTSRSFSLDGRDPLSLERAGTPPYDEPTKAMRVLGWPGDPSAFTGVKGCISFR